MQDIQDGIYIYQHPQSLSYLAKLKNGITKVNIHEICLNKNSGFVTYSKAGLVHHKKHMTGEVTEPPSIVLNVRVLHIYIYIYRLF